MSIGILASLAGATLQAVNYAATQKCQQSHSIGGVKLLLAVHIGMGAMALIPCLLLGHYTLLAGDIWLDLLKVNLPYLFAQFVLIKAIQSSGASIVSPLLALKIPVLALIAWLSGQLLFESNQLISIACIMGLACFFSSLSGRIRLVPLLLVLCASLGYSLSDIAITDFSRTFDGSAIEQVFTTICLNYTVCGAFALLAGIPYKVKPADVYHTRWAALSWFVGVIFLILGFNLAGVVSANVVQTLRGVIGVAIAYYLFRHQSDQPDASVWKKKGVASIAMVAAVAVYYL